MWLSEDPAEKVIWSPPVQSDWPRQLNNRVKILAFECNWRGEIGVYDKIKTAEGGNWTLTLLPERDFESQIGVFGVFSQAQPRSALMSLALENTPLTQKRITKDREDSKDKICYIFAPGHRAGHSALGHRWPGNARVSDSRPTFPLGSDLGEQGGHSRGTALTRTGLDFPRDQLRSPLFGHNLGTDRAQCLPV